MLTLNTSIGERLQQVRSDVGTNIELRPAGSFGAIATGDTLSDAVLSRVATVPGVVNVNKQLAVQYTGTDLQPALPEGFGNRSNPNGGTGNGQNQQPGNFGRGRRGFAGASVQVVGVTGAASQVTLLGGGTPQLVEGRDLTNADASANVAIMGKTLADANGVTIGSQLAIEGTPVQVVGLFSSGQRFGDNSLLMPMQTVQHLYGLEGEYTQATVQVSTLDQVQTVATQLQSIVDTNSVDIVTDQQRLEATSQALQAVQGSTQTGLIVAVLTAALVIVFAVVLVVRERRREIGILKALGASNGHVIGQFAVEVLTLSLASALLAFGVLAVAGQTITNQFAIRGAGQGGFGRFAGGFAGNFAGPGGLGGAANQAGSAGLSIDTLLLVLGLGVALAVIASIVPAWQVARIKPAEVLRFA
jgi:putative ABC transport system permease protein